MTTTIGTTPPRRDRRFDEPIHDTYKLGGKLQEPARCPRCRAAYIDGRWTWSDDVRPNEAECVCSACHRIADNYPAGEITLSGRFLQQHRDEIVGLARNLEETERAEHPMNRIIAVRDLPGLIQITTTDVHLPRRIAKAVQGAWDGELDIHFDKEGYFTSIIWHRDE